MGFECMLLACRDKNGEAGREKRDEAQAREERAGVIYIDCLVAVSGCERALGEDKKIKCPVCSCANK